MKSFFGSSYPGFFVNFSASSIARKATRSLGQWMAVTFMLWGAGTLPAQTAHYSASQSLVKSSGLSFPHGVAVDKNGNVYIADLNNNRILRETPTTGGYAETVVASSGLNQPAGVAVDANGNVFIADTFNNRILKETLSSGGYTESVIPTSGLRDPLGIAVDGVGNLYITDSYNADVVKLTSSNGSYTQSWILGGPTWPDGIAVDTDGNVYVAAPYDNRVIKLSPSGNGYTSSDIGTGHAQPHGVAVDSTGNIFIAESGTNNILKEAPSGSTYTQTVVAAGLNEPQAVTVDLNGSLYFNDPNDGQILKLWLGAGNFGSVGIGVQSSDLSLTFTFDSGGMIAVPGVVTQGATGLDYVDAGTGTCTTNGTAHVYSPGDTCTVDVTFTPKAPGARYGAAVLRDNAGNVIATAYMQGTGIGPQVSFPPGTQSMVPLSGFTSPWAVAVDSAGNIFVANAVVGYDYPENRVVKETWNGNGYTASTVATRLGFPTGLAVDGAGNVYIADQDSFKVYKETPNLDGTYTQSIVDDTLGTVAGIAVDASGNVYVGRGGIGVEKETLSGGSYTRSEIFYRFYAFAIGVDASGSLYIADGSTTGIRKETPSGSGYTESFIASGQNIFQLALDGLGDIFYRNGSQLQKLTPTESGYQQSTVASAQGLGLAVDPRGNLYFSTYDSQTRNGDVWKVNLADPPSLNFAASNLGVTSSDSPQTVTLANIGNADLTFPIPASGSNPSLPPSFVLDDSATSACPQISSGASSPGTLAAGSTCAISISFVPLTGGPVNGALTIIDTALNATSPDYATQTIALSGTGVGTKFTATIGVVSSAPSAFVSSPVTLTATVSASSGSPTGTVVFYDGTTQLGTGTIGAGVASYTTSSLAAGTHSITAAYSGDSTFNAVNSAALTEAIEDFTLSVPNGSSSSATVTAGAQASYTVAVAPSGGTTMPAAITLTATGLPAGSTATFSPLNVAAGAGATNLTLTVKVSSQNAAARPTAPLGRRSVPVALGAIFLLATSRLRKGARRFRGMVVVLLIGLGSAATLAVSACGSRSSLSGNVGGTTPQTYSMTVTAASGSLSHSTNLTLTVQ